MSIISFSAGNSNIVAALGVKRQSLAAEPAAHF